MKEMEFYESLAPYYDFLCGDRREDVLMLRRILAFHGKTGGTLLDVACGTGLEDRSLQRHFSVTGIDLHAGVLALARKRNPSVRYVRADMRSFRLRRTFDVILCLDALCYLRSDAEFLRTLRNFSRHLAKGGLLVFYLDPIFLWEHNRRRTTTVIDHRVSAHREVTLSMIFRRWKQHLITRDTFTIAERGKTIVVTEPECTYGFFRVSMIVEMLRRCGFRVTLYTSSRQATFSLRRYRSGEGRPVFVCEKVAGNDALSVRR